MQQEPISTTVFPAGDESAKRTQSSGGPLEMLPEERLLLAIARLNPSRADFESAARIVSQPDFSWERAWNLSAEQWVHPLLAHNINVDPELRASVPEELRPVLGLSQFAAKLRQAVYLQAAEPVFRKLAADGIAVALMKGAAVLSLYPAGTRLLNDMDILIHNDDYTQVAAALEASGFEKVLKREVRQQGQSEEFQRRAYHEMRFVKRPRQSHQRPLVLDVHWSMHRPGRAFAIETTSLFSRARPIRFGSASMLVLSPEDTLVNYGTQLFDDRLALGLLRLNDISALASSGVCWTKLCEIAEGATATGTTYLCLSAASQFGAKVPAEILGQLQTSFPACRFVADFLSDPRWPFYRWRVAHAACNVLTPLLCSSRRRRIREFGGVPGRAYRLARRDGSPPWLALGQSLRATVLSLACGAVLGAMRTAEVLRAHRLARRLRRLLWRQQEDARPG